MKRIIIGLVAMTVCAALLLSACGGNNAPAESTAPAEETTAETTAEPTTEETTAAPDEPVVGGWMINEQIETAVLTEDAQAAFDKALQGFAGIDLEPAALLATQVVAGTNYMYLCAGKTVVQDPVAGWYLVTVYQDLEGNAQVTMCEDFYCTDVKTADSTVPSDVVGGWAIQPPADAVTLPEDIQGAFNTAAEAYEDVALSPLAYLASQVVAGTNYKIFCQGTTAGDNPTDGLYVATLYVDLQGNAEFTDVEQIDLLAYLEGAQEEDAEPEAQEGFEDYVGYQFAGTDPWGGEVTITIRSITDNTLEASYTDVLGETLTLYTEMTEVPIEDNVAPFNPAGFAIDDENTEFSYTGTLEFSDGQLILTYESGEVTTNSTEGGSTAYHVEALDEAAKTVTLTKTADPTEED